MNKKNYLSATLLSCMLFVCDRPAHADLILSVRDVQLMPNQGNQEILVFAQFSSSPNSSVNRVGGLQLNARIGDGLGVRGSRPVFQGANPLTNPNDNSLGINFAGTVWDGAPLDISTPRWEGFGQYAAASVSVQSASNARTLTTSEQIVAKLIVDTTGVSSGSFALVLDDAVIGSSYFLSDTGVDLRSATTFRNGSFTVAVPEPSAGWLVAMGLSSLCHRRTRRGGALTN